MMRTSTLPLLALLLLASRGAAEESITSLDLPDTKGAVHRMDAWAGRKAVVLFFVGVECPVSNFYAPEMERVRAEYADRGVAFQLIYSEPDAAAERVAAHVAEYGLTLGALLDPGQALARQAGVNRVLTVVVASAEGNVLYRGRIDDRFSEDGKRRDEPTTRDLRDALDAVLDGKTPAMRETPVFGCPLPEVPAASR